MDGGSLAFAVDVPGHSKCLRSFLSLKSAQLDAGTNSGWAHVAMLGTWEGHAKGSFSFTQQAFEQILTNFSAQRNPIPWDYEHDTFRATSGAKPASGWVQRLELRNNGTELWAYVDWTARAAQMIRDGEYKYCSPVVDFESFDRKTNNAIGAELVSVALTNNPFLDGQHQIQLTWVAAAEPKGPPTQPGLPPKDLAAQPHVPVAPGSPPPPPAATDPAVADAALGDGSEADANAFLDALADGSGLDKAQTLAALLDMKDMLINALQKTVARDGTPAEAQRTMTVDKKLETPSAQPVATPAPAAPVITSTPAPIASVPTEGLTMDALERANDKAVIAKMAERLAAIEAERAAEKQQAIVQLVDERIASGHVPSEQRDTAIWAFTQDRTRAEQIYQHKQIPIGQRQSTTLPSGAPAGGGPASADKTDKTIDMSQFNHGELMTIDCLMGAHKTREQACAIVLKRRTGIN